MRTGTKRPQKKSKVPKVGVVEVSLSRHHCRALAWWLKARYIPWMADQFRASPSADHAGFLATAGRLARWFDRQGRRRIKGDDQDREALRTIKRSDAAWLGALLSASSTGAAPTIVSGSSVEFPSTRQLAQMPPEAAREFILRLGAYQAMSACGERAYSQTLGRPRTHRTPASVAKQRVGNLLTGGDERYERRLKRRAEQDERDRELRNEFSEAILELTARALTD